MKNENKFSWKPWNALFLSTVITAASGGFINAAFHNASIFTLIAGLSMLMTGVTGILGSVLFLINSEQP